MTRIDRARTTASLPAQLAALSGASEATMLEPADARAWFARAPFIAAQTLAAEGFVIIAAELKPGRSLTFTEAAVYGVDGTQRALALKASATMALVDARRKPRDA